MAKSKQTDQELEQGIKFGLKAMAWHGWGSPVGLGLFILAVAASIWLISQA